MLSLRELHNAPSPKIKGNPAAVMLSWMLISAAVENHNPISAVHIHRRNVTFPVINAVICSNATVSHTAIQKPRGAPATRTA